MARTTLSIDHLFRCSAIMGIAMAPDGAHGAIHVRTPNVDKQRNEASLWLWTAATGEVRQLTNGPADGAPKWLDAKTIIFTAGKRDEDEAKEKPFRKTRIFTISIDGGEPRRRAIVDGSVFDMAPSPNGKHVLLSFSPHPKLSEFDKATAETAPAPLIPRGIRYRLDGMGELPAALPGIYMLDVKGSPWKPPVKVIDTDRRWEGGAEWLPDSSGFVFSSVNSDEKFGRARLFLANVKGEAKELALPEGGLLAWAISPDGKQLAFSANDELVKGSYMSSPLRLRSLDPKDKKWTTLATSDGKFGEASVLGDNSPGGTGRLAWETPSTLLAVHSLKGRARLVRVNAESGNVEVLAGADNVVNVFSTAKETTLYAMSAHDQPGEVFALGKSRPQSSFNAAVKKAFTTRVVTFFHKTDPRIEIEGFVWATDEQLKSKKKAAFPLVVYIHGGPTVATGTGFMHEYSWLAAQGFPVLTLNPRGSTTYGDEQGAAIYGAWGDKDVKDILAVREETLKRYPQFDPARTFIVGGSYGGYMANWMVTRHPGLFRAGISERCVFNLLSFAGTSDFSNVFPPVSLGLSNVWENPADAWARSPIALLPKVTEPLLILHSDTDWRCPVTQAEELFTGLLELGKKLDEEVRLVIFRGESHDLSRGGRPANRKRRLEEILAWLKKHNKARKGIGR